MVERLPHKHEGGSLILRIHMKQWSVVGYTCNPGAGEGEAERGRCPALPASSSTRAPPASETCHLLKKEKKEEKGQGFESRRLVHGRAGEENSVVIIAKTFLKYFIRGQQKAGEMAQWGKVLEVQL